MPGKPSYISYGCAGGGLGIGWVGGGPGGGACTAVERLLDINNEVVVAEGDDTPFCTESHPRGLCIDRGRVSQLISMISTTRCEATVISQTHGLAGLDVDVSELNIVVLEEVEEYLCSLVRPVLRPN